MKQIKITIKNGILEYHKIVDVSEDYIQKLKNEYDNRIIYPKEATETLNRLVESMLKMTSITTNEQVEVEEFDESGLSPDKFKTLVFPSFKENTIEDSIEGLDIEDVW